ncbi:GlsB/YeaQ/YmgE family stress response membrane protein [Kordia sp.]|uniref:GlsB/YeaQ/YmgE family stress response membrane protein n=1 Tax=Kordia sp. TaxID=1965332 RepID=UPI0025BE9E5F|nr:GlsB/YeaQ/YmgE family stress response membrane protein [Kordia sp.]MCH2193235.1 GlsB/YeaQ/YmgE family stress response membrane protein [Kordia sp.]
MGLLYSLLVGAVAGWLAGKLMRGGGFGVLLNIILGIIGGVVAGWLFKELNIDWFNSINSILADILKGAIGASVVLFVASLFKK